MSNSKYSGMAEILVDFVDRLGNSEYSVFSSMDDRGFHVAAPEISVLSANRIKKEIFLVMCLSAITKYMHNSMLYANNLYWNM